MKQDLTGELPNTNNTAFLSSKGSYTTFNFGKDTLTFIAPYSLERYIQVIEWDKGYLVVLTKYAHSSDPIEEYIDLIPILKELYMDPDAFLCPIDTVEVQYD